MSGGDGAELDRLVIRVCIAVTLFMVLLLIMS